MRLADAVWKRIKQETDTVYFLPGGGAAFLVDALAQSGLNAVCMSHEQGAGFAAVAHAQIAGFAVVLVTTGPGATNAITPCAAAWVDSAPVLFISGQANSNTTVGKTELRTRGIQEVDIIPVVKPITKEAHQYTGSMDIRIILDVMIAKCKEGRRGPCWLSVPLDVQQMEVME